MNAQKIYNIGRYSILILLLFAIPAFADAITYFSVSDVTNTNFTLIGYKTTTNLQFLQTFPFVITYTPTTITTLNENQTTTVQMSYPLSYKSGNYTNYLVIKSDNQTISKSITLNIPSIPDVEVNDTKINTNMGEKILYYLPIKNTGNTDVNLAINSTCNDFITYDTSLSIDYNKQNKLLLQFTPENEVKKECNMTFVGTGINKKILLNFTFNDTILPKVYRFAVRQAIPQAGNNITIYMNVTDNIKINRITGTLTGEYETQNLNFTFNPDTNYYETYFVTYIPHNYNFVANVVDTNNNTVTETLVIKFSQKQSIVYSDLINFYTKKYGEEVQKELFTFKEKVPVNITVSSLLLTENTTPIDFSIFVIDETGRRFNLTGFEKVELTDVTGVLMLATNASKEVKFDGTLNIETVNYVNISNEIRFIGRYSNYSEFEPYDTNILGITMHCESDTESLVPVCTLTYPVGVKISDLVLPITIDQKQSNDRMYQTQIQEINEKYKSELFWKRLLISIIIILIISYVGYEVISKKYIPKN